MLPGEKSKDISLQPTAGDTHIEAANMLGPISVRVETDFTSSGDEFEAQSVELNLPGLSKENVNELLAERMTGTSVRPQLVWPDAVTAPEVYMRLREQDMKNEHRGELRNTLLNAWKEKYGDDKSQEILAHFNQLSTMIQDDGAVVFGDLIDRGAFGRLVENYDELMRRDGSQSLLHSYANLRNQPDFLANKEFNGAFFHPLAIALISEKVGGAVRVVDARAKDAGPISVRAQDNMLHIDNTPYRDEYKVLVTWEKGKASGPRGQNFVFLPGTHLGVRDSLIGPHGPYSTENGSIFIHEEDVRQAFSFQQQVRPGGNEVVEIQDTERPLTTVFPSGSLVHHRMRTEDGHPRSGLIIAFHRASDSPGEFIGNYQQDNTHDLERALFGYQDANSDTEFREMLSTYATAIAAKVEELFTDAAPATVIDQKTKTLTPNEMDEWYKIATDAPTVEDIKGRAGYFPLGDKLSYSEFLKLLGSEMMIHDKHGPIDMILYADGHEEPRKWARNRIREMRSDVLQERLDGWSEQIRQPAVADLLTPDQMDAITDRLAEIANNVSPEEREKGSLEPIERITPEEAYRSVEQLIIDLGENLTRADERQTYLSAALFQFWACDELNRLQDNTNPELRELGGQLLRNYIAATVLIEKQIANEKAAA
jgi:hypothetical protein